MITVNAFTLAAIFAVWTVQSASASGIPEPGFFTFGAFTNGNLNDVSSGTSVSWTMTSATETCTNTATLVNVNGQNFYFATIPFETRSIGGISLGTPTPNTLSLNAVPTTYARQATVNGTNAVIVYASSGTTNTFTFGPADRGRVERVDLSVSPPATFAQWLAQYGLPANSDPNSDPTHKGMTLYQDYMAGTNPTNRNSLFKMEINVKPIVQGGQFAGITIQWDSLAGKTYTVYRSQNLGLTFQPLQTVISAAPPLNSLSDSTATGSGPYFYRIQVDP